MKHLYDNETRNDKFMTLHPRGGNFGVKKRVKLIYLFQNRLIYSGALFRQTKYNTVMITQKGYTKIVIS